VFLMPLVIVIVFFSIDPLSGIVLLVTAPVLPIFMILIGMQAEALTKKQWKLMSLMSAHFLDVLQGITTLKLFGRSAAQEETIRNVSERFRHTTMHVLRVAFLSSLVMEMGATLSTAIVAVEIGLRLLYGQMAFQPALFVLLLAPEFYLPLRTLGTRYHAGMTGSAAAQRIFEILEIPLPSDALIPVIPCMGSRETGIRFEDVSFAYDESRQVLKNVSLHIEPGQQVALVGASGAGKSTLAHLLLRFMEPESGTISINGISCKEMSANEWREQIAWAPQRPYLFNATVAENIRLAVPNATHDEIVQAAQQADAHEFILQLPQGYATIIGERGTRLSGGQVQRLSLARAFLKNAPVLIVDEATSNLDTEQEAQVLAAIQRLMQGRMVLIIAHHLSTIYSTDQVIMLADGQVVDADMKHRLIGIQ
jgi:ATP-binding cassette, subfamily C, bacterial CydD